MSERPEKVVTLSTECGGDDEFAPAPSHVSIEVNKSFLERVAKLAVIVTDNNLDHASFRDEMNWGGWVNGPYGPMECQMVAVDKHGYFQLEGIPKHCDHRVQSKMIKCSDLLAIFEAPEITSGNENFLVDGDHIFYSGSNDAEVLRETILEEQSQITQNDVVTPSP